MTTIQDEQQGHVIPLIVLNLFDMTTIQDSRIACPCCGVVLNLFDMTTIQDYLSYEIMH